LTEERDHELVAKSLQGNEKAFRTIVERYHATTYAAVRAVLGDRDDVEDVVQMVYIKVYKGLARFRGDSKLSTWIYQIARNEAISAVKKRQLDTTPIEDVTIADHSAMAATDADFQREQLRNQLEEAFTHLDDQQRMALELRYMAERSYEEISETMGIPLGTVKTYIYRGKAELKKVLGRTDLKK